MPGARLNISANELADAGLAAIDWAPALEAHPARESLLAFTQFTWPAYRAEPAHELIAATLDKVVEGDIKRLMIFAPPQHGKSELTSVRLPAYWLGKRPNDPVILTSYVAALAQSKSRQARAIVESTEFREAFPSITTWDESRAVNQWSLTPPLRGSMLAAGAGGPITGHGALLGIIDDPFANWEQSQSLTIREKVWDWYRTTFRTRIWEGGAIVLITTRWHEDDLAGRLLLEGAEEWTVLRLPALAETQMDRDASNKLLRLQEGEPDQLGREPDEALCPQLYSKEALGILRRAVGSQMWTAGYQGAPRAAEGNRFKRWMFPIVEETPVIARRVRYWDKAGTKDGGKATAGVLVARGADGVVSIESVISGHWSAGEREAVIKQTAQLDAQQFGRGVETWMEQEPGSGGKESAESTIKNLAGYPVHADKVTGDKDVRLEPFLAQAEAGNVRLKQGEWNGPYIEQMCAIPNGIERDAADATGGGFNMLMGGAPQAGPSVLAGKVRRQTHEPVSVPGLPKLLGGRRKR